MYFYQNRFLQYYSMIYPQQQTSKVLYTDLSQQSQNNKISLKTNRSQKQATRTKRTFSSYSTHPTLNNDSLAISKQQNQVSTIEGMFRYCLAQNNCYGVFSCAKEEQLEGTKIASKTQLLNQTAQSLRSSSSYSVTQKTKKNPQTLIADRSSCPKNVTKNLFLKQDSFFTDNDKILPTIDFTSLQLPKLTDKRKSLCENNTERNGTHTKFSLKTKRSNLAAETIIIDKSDPKQRLAINTHKINQFVSQQIEAGCLCLPQCFWIDKWSKLIKDRTITDLKNKNLNPKILAQIQKDIGRTQPRQQFFKEIKNLNSLKEVLINYSLISPSLGYVQGMNFIASILVYHSNSIKQSSSIFNFIMKQKQYERIYEGDLHLSLNLARNVASQLEQLQPELFNYIIKSGIQIDIYLRSFYFSMLANFVPLQSMYLVIDKYIKKGFQGINQLLLALLVFLKTQILELSQEEVGLVFTIPWLQKRCKKIDWMQLMGFSQTIVVNKISF